MRTEIINEDKDILVCFKPAGIATQTAKLSGQDMVSLIKNYLAKQTGTKSPYVGVIHRLDQPVSGLLVFAKNQKAAASLSRQIQDGNANKDYIALCLGTLKEKRGTLTHYMMKDPLTKLAKVIDEEKFAEIKEVDKKQELSFRENLQAAYKKAILTYEVEKEYEDFSVIRIHLETGRFHQIRAQFSYIGHPLLGDVKYESIDSKEMSKKHKIRMVALCADRLVFVHPVNRKRMEFVLPESKLPQEMRK